MSPWAPIAIVGGMLLYPVRIALGVAVISAFILLAQIFPSIAGKPVAVLALLIASFCVYYSIESNPDDDERLMAMPLAQRKQELKARSKRSNKVGALLFLASLVVGCLFWFDCVKGLSQ